MSSCGAKGPHLSHTKSHIFQITPRAAKYPKADRLLGNGRNSGALHPWSPDDLDLLCAIGRAEFLINGFRNPDLSQALHGAPPQDHAARRRRSGAVTRRIRLLRAHGLVHKRPKSHRYVVSPKGHRIISALLAAYQANTESLSKLAA